MAHATAIYDRSPFSHKEYWPVTGPVYGLVDDESFGAASGFWKRLVGRLDREEPKPEGPLAPIYY